MRSVIDGRMILENEGLREDQPDLPHTRKINALEFSETILETVLSIGRLIPVCDTTFCRLGLRRVLWNFRDVYASSPVTNQINQGDEMLLTVVSVLLSFTMIIQVYTWLNMVIPDYYGTSSLLRDVLE